MDRLFRAFPFVVMAVLVLLCLQGLVETLVPPYTDQQIRESLVDTWEVNVWSTLAVVGFVAVIGVFAAAFAFWGFDAATQRVARVILGLAALAAFLAYSSHVALTRRTTQLTGQTFGFFHGLF